MTARPARPGTDELIEQLIVEVRALRAEVQGVLRARAALDAGRARAIAEKRKRAAYTRSLVLETAAADHQAGRPARGRAGRVARKLNGLVSEGQARKILRALSSARDSAGYNAEKESDQCSTRTS